jgi:hypothetical protein
MKRRICQSQAVRTFSSIQNNWGKMGVSLGSGCADAAVTAFHQGNECNE